jgi:hypothetical protein
LFDKYINVRDDKDEIDVESKIWSVMKDLHILFRIEENDDISQKALSELGNKPVRENTYFKNKLYEWISEFREMAISQHLAEGINLIEKGFKQCKVKLNEFFKSQKEQDVKNVQSDQMEKILEEVMKIIHVRLLSLEHSVPKDDSSIVKESEEKEY